MPSSPTPPRQDSAPLGQDFLRRVILMSLILAAVFGALGAARIGGSWA